MKTKMAPRVSTAKEETVKVSRSLKHIAFARRASDCPEFSEEFATVQGAINWLKNKYPKSVGKRIRIFEELWLEGISQPYKRLVAEFHWLELFPAGRVISNQAPEGNSVEQNRIRLLKLTGFSINKWEAQQDPNSFPTLDSSC